MSALQKTILKSKLPPSGLNFATGRLEHYVLSLKYYKSRVCSVMSEDYEFMNETWFEILGLARRELYNESEIMIRSSGLRISMSLRTLLTGIIHFTIIVLGMRVRPWCYCMEVDTALLPGLNSL